MSLAEFTSGALFGAALLGAGVYAPSVIKAQMTFESNTMITVMMGASATSAIVLDILDRNQIRPKKIGPASNLGYFQYDGNVLGGALIGLGMGATGACPGTALVQVGVGMANGLLVVIGGVLGAMLYTTVRREFDELRPANNNPGEAADDGHSHHPNIGETGAKPKDIASALGLQPLTLLLIWVPMCLAVIGLAFTKDETVRRTPEFGLVPPAYGGLLIGVAQLATTLLAGHALGVSTAFRDLGDWVDYQTTRHRSSDSQQTKKSFFTPSVVFSGGVVCATAAISHFFMHQAREDFGLVESWSKILEPRMALRPLITMAGGMSMVFGARLAGGCTSGHGISGLAQFSIASLVTTAALFSGGIVAANLMRY